MGEEERVVGGVAVGWLWGGGGTVATEMSDAVTWYHRPPPRHLLNGVSGEGGQDVGGV